MHAVASLLVGLGSMVPSIWLPAMIYLHDAGLHGAGLCLHRNTQHPQRHAFSVATDLPIMHALL
jgi:hypothetical protein